MYSDEVLLTGDNVLQILNLAKKYILEGLTKKCTEYLENNISAANVCDLLTHSVRFGEKELVDKCLQLAASQTDQVLISDGFLNISHEALLRMLKYELLPDDKTVSVIEACLKWADKNKGELSERDVLGDCVYQLRFNKLTAQMFSKLVGSSSVLSGDEKNLFFCFSLTNDQEYKKKIHELGFNTSSRMMSLSASGSMFTDPYPKYTNPSYQCVVNFQMEEIRLSVTAPVIFHGISVYSGPKGFVHNIAVKITDEPSGTQLGQIQSSFTSDNNDIVPVYLSEAIRFEPGTYIVYATPPNETQCLISGYQSEFTGPTSNVEIFRRKGIATAYPTITLGYIYSFHVRDAM